MVFLRQSAQGIRSLFETDSVLEQMMAQMLATTGRRPSPGEVRSWKASLPILANDLVAAGLGNVEVLVEHQLPLSSGRIDAILAGHHPISGDPSYVLIELKQWSSAETYDNEPSLVQIAAYGNSPVLHPVLQVSGYRQYLLDFLPALSGVPERVSAVAYLHNATDQQVLGLRELPSSEQARMFTGQRKGDFMDFLRTKLSTEVGGTDAADSLLGMKSGPSKQLLTVVAAELQDRTQFVLLDEQRVAYELVLHEVERARASDSKCVIVVTGGPGTGKSVIALSLLGELARQGRSVLHATGSRSFTLTMRQIAGRGSTRVKGMFKYFNSFMSAERNGLDVLILDEAHRIRETSANRWTRAAFRSDRAQVDELLDAARVPVFLLDEYQVVRPGEMGTVAAIEQAAEAKGLRVLRVSLDDQFRCGGSEAYVRWVQRLLGLEDGGPCEWDPDSNFELKTASSPRALEDLLDEKSSEGYGARMTAGYCWRWSDPTPEGGLVNDVVIGDWAHPWNVRADRAVGGFPPSALWASDPAGFSQVGCVYTAQGFEYDWNGVILGPDLVWRTDRWVPVRDANKDPDFKSRTKVSDVEFGLLLINVYKVLLTRGMVGTVVYSCDPETQELLNSLIPS